MVFIVVLCFTYSEIKFYLTKYNYLYYGIFNTMQM